jgi:hypothetical protein
MSVLPAERYELLDRYGRFYGQERFAVAFTETTEGDDAKRVVTKGWDRSAPLATGDFGAGLIGNRGKQRNVAIVLRPSNLIVLECDTEEDLVRIAALNLPETLTVQSSAAYKRHFYFRPAPELESLPYVAFRFESGKLTADSGRYFLAPPSIHPSGAVYSFLPEHGPAEIPIAVLPVDIYNDLARQARVEDSALRESIALDPGAKIKAGNRRDFLFRYACMLRRWGLSREEILAQTLQFNQTRCDPPVDAEFVSVQVDGAMKKQGGQEIAAAAALPPPPEHNDPGPERETPPAVEIRTLQVLTARQTYELPDPPIEDMLLGPAVVRRYRTIIAAGTGQGKTTLSLAMLAAIVNGTQLLGWKGSGGCRALFVDLEQGLRTVKRRIAESHIEQNDRIDVVRVPDGLALDQDLADRLALQQVLENGYDVVLADPHYKMHRGDANEERATVDLMRQLDAWRDHYGFALILPAHNRKALDPNAKLTIDDVFGSSALVRGAEIVLGIRLVKQGYSRLHFFKDRDGDLPVGGEPWGLLFDQEHGYRRDPADEAAPRDFKQELLDLNLTPEWRTLKEYRALLEAGEAATKTALETLVVEREYEYAIGPTGRSAKAKCWRPSTALTIPEQSRAVDAVDAPADEGGTTAPTDAPPLGGGSTRCSSTAGPTTDRTNTQDGQSSDEDNGRWQALFTDEPYLEENE